MAISSNAQARKSDDARVDAKRDLNRDPVSGTPGAHPVGVGVGAAAVGAAGAAIGSVVPGAGTLLGGAIGAVIGAIGGGLAGKGVAEVIDPTAEDAYWRSELPNRPYFDDRFTYDDDYAPAYGFGYAMRFHRSDRPFSAAESGLRDEWENARGRSRLDWDQARPVISDAWSRYDQLNQHRKAGSTRRVSDDSEPR